MALKSQILVAYKNFLITRTGAFSTVSGYISDVNDFPSIAILIPRETRYHIGDGNVIKQFTMQVRGYVFMGDGEDSLNNTETLADEIEVATNLFAESETAALLQIFNIQVNSLSTDEGLLTPYGMCDLEVMFELC